jgi:MFS family permease
MYRPATGALIADMLPAERRRMGYAYYRLAINVGVAAGAAAAGFLADRSYRKEGEKAPGFSRGMNRPLPVDQHLF